MLQPIRLNAIGLGKFGKPHDATLHLQIQPTDELIKLAELLREELRNRGISFDEKKFRPHITLARRARIPKGSLPQLQFPQPALAHTVTFYKSTLTSEGALYKPLYSCLLYTSDAADDLLCVDLGGRRIFQKKKKKRNNRQRLQSINNIY